MVLEQGKNNKPGKAKKTRPDDRGFNGKNAGLKKPQPSSALYVGRKYSLTGGQRWIRNSGYFPAFHDSIKPVGPGDLEDLIVEL